MAYIYGADIWCDDCGADIRRRLTAEGMAPADPNDEWSYDSNIFPKQVGDDDESDTPTHCAANENCINAIEIEGGKVGLLFGELTLDGIKYIDDAIAEANSDCNLDTKGSWCEAVVGLWYQHYTDNGYEFKNEPDWI